MIGHPCFLLGKVGIRPEEHGELARRGGREGVLSWHRGHNRRPEEIALTPMNFGNIEFCIQNTIGGVSPNGIGARSAAHSRPCQTEETECSTLETASRSISQNSRA